MSTRILTGDCRDVLRSLPAESVHCAVTSPPYFGLRDYGMAGQIGLEPTPAAFVDEMVAVFREVRRVLRDDGTLWLNLGDSYNNRTKVRTSSHQPSLNGFTDDNWAERAARGGVRMSNGMGVKEKDLLMIPARVALALQADGWWLRSDIIWHKPNPMPESVTDRPTSSHEHVFLLAKSERYLFDADAVAEGLRTDPKERYEERAKITGRGTQGAADARGNDRDKSGGFPPRNRGVPPRHAAYASSDQSGLDDVGRGGRRNIRNVWTIATRPFAEAHFATFPPALIEPCIKAGCPAGGTVLDPFFGAGTTGLVADRLGRDCIGVEINPEYAAMARRRIEKDAGMFAIVA